MDNNGIISEMQLKQKSPPCIWQVLQETVEIERMLQLSALLLLTAYIEILPSLCERLKNVGSGVVFLMKKRKFKSHIYF